jgi:hypothetical protein
MPLIFVNSIFAPISALDSFSITSATGFNAAKRWTCRLAATLFNNVPIFLAAALN